MGLVFMTGDIAIDMPRPSRSRWPKSHVSHPGPARGCGAAATPSTARPVHPRSRPARAARAIDAPPRGRLAHTVMRLLSLDLTNIGPFDEAHLDFRAVPGSEETEVV